LKYTFYIKNFIFYNKDKPHSGEVKDFYVETCFLTVEVCE